jgi:hypothetical protein
LRCVGVAPMYRGRLRASSAGAGVRAPAGGLAHAADAPSFAISRGCGAMKDQNSVTTPATPTTTQKPRLRLSCSLLVAAFSLVACGQEGESLGASGQATGSMCPEDSMPTYASFGSDFMQRYCTRCHAASLRSSARQGAPSDHNFDTLEGLRATDAAHIDEHAAAGPGSVNTAMPPSLPRPTMDERRKLGEWLACGMP